MSYRTVLAVVACLSTAALAGCHSSQEDSFHFIAKDYTFEGPSELPTGWVTLTMTNEGPDLHHMMLYRLKDGHDKADVVAFFDDPEHGPMPNWMVAVGGPGAVIPGKDSTAVMHLEAGEHVLLCEIPDSQGTLHVKHGMIHAVTVTEAAGTGGDEPDGDVVVELHDFSFIPKKPLAAGVHTVEIQNKGEQVHEIVPFSLMGDATTEDLLAAFGPNATGPPPGEPLGGVSGIASGDVAYFDFDLAPGRYTLVCFFPDPESGAPHFALGMIYEFTVA